MSEEMTAANVENVADSQNESVSPDVVESEGQGEQQQQDVTQTQAFARRLKEEKQRAIDAEYSRLYGQEYGIHSKADYDSYLERQKLLEEGKDPELYQELKHVKSEMESLKREKTLIEQDKQLSNDKVYGDLYKEWKSEIQEFAETYNVDYNSAFTVLCREKIPQILQKFKQKESVAEANSKNSSSSTGSIAGNGVVKDDFISLDTFNANRKNQSWVNKNYNSIIKSRAKW